MVEHLDPALRTPLYAQLAVQLRAAIAFRELIAGEALPSVGRLAAELWLQPRTVVQACRDLERAGLVELRKGAGTFVRELTTSRRAAGQAAAADRLASEMLARGVALGLSGVDPRVRRGCAAGHRVHTRPGRICPGASALYTNLTVAEACASVAGMSLGEWYRIQLRRQMAVAGLPDPREATFWPSALGILALALGTVLWRAGRRQVR